MSQLSRKPGRNKGMYVLIAIPLVLAATFIWEIASTMFHAEVVVRQAASVSQVSLEPDPAGARVDFVVVDRFGQETTTSGSLDVRVREPDGTLWQTHRSVSDADFQPLPDGSLMAGRVGYSVVVPATDWARPPRRGGLATVSVSVTPSGADMQPFSTESQQRFP